MRKKYALINSILMILAVAIVAVVTITFTSLSFDSESKHAVYRLMDAYSSSYNDTNPSLTLQSKDVRVRYIASNGMVFCDSLDNNPTNGLFQNDQNEDVLQLREIQNALQARQTGSVNNEIVERNENGHDLLCYAVTVDSAEDEAGYVFIWLSVASDSINGYLWQTIPLYVTVAIIGVGVCLLISLHFTRASLKPLKVVGDSLESITRGDYVHPDLPEAGKDTKEMLDRLDQIATSLNTTISSLEEEKIRTNLILENISDGLVVLDENQNIILCNQKAKEIFEVDENVIGQNAKVLEKSKEPIDFSTVSNIFDYEHNGKIYLCSYKETEKMSLIVMTDVTTERQASETRKQFFDSASHELKTPLTSIRGFNELVEMSNDDPKVKEYCRLIDKESAHMMSLVSDMLRLSEIEKREKEVYEEIELSVLAQEVKESLKPLLERKGVTLEIKGKSTIRMNPKDGSVLLKNLMENAINYNKEGGNVKVEFAKDYFKVSDNGIGIPEKDLPHIYDRFYRVDKSRSKESGGTGLGLSIVKHLCTYYGFSITCKSTLGKGTEFVVTFNNEGKQ